MNVLFLSLLDFYSIEEINIYCDLLREFRDNGHSVYVVSPFEAGHKKHTYTINGNGFIILKQKIGNIQKTNTIKKGISTLTLQSTIKKAIKHFFANVKFDLVLYSTPPITFYQAIAYVKRRDNAKTYLLLKDIFPQNSVDLGMLSKSGVKGRIYRYFRRKERQLYGISDKIGCMSEANRRYILMHNSHVTPEKIEVCPNSVAPRDMSLTSVQRKAIRERYGLPLEKKIFVYGGNLGKPQGVDFIIKCLQKQRFDDVFFLIVGSGTEFGKLKEFADTADKDNVKVMSFIPKEDYDKLVGSCDVGMIFLDYRFTIPNFPSRLLAYMQAKLPVLCATDPNTDIGMIAENNGFGISCPSNDTNGFIVATQKLLHHNLGVMGEKGYEYLMNHYAVKQSYEIILNGINNENSSY